MNFDDYQIAAARTINHDLSHRNQLACAALGLAGEAGEAADMLKKHLFHDHPLDRAKLVGELGDVLWYLATLATTLGVTLDEVASGNVAKLRARYPAGFSADKSINRDSQ